MARQGFEIFAALMEFAFDDGKPSALAAFEATGRAYLAFARKYPGHYMAMFEAGLSPADHRTSRPSRGARAPSLKQAADLVTAHLAAGRRPPGSMVARISGR